MKTASITRSEPGRKRRFCRVASAALAVAAAWVPGATGQEAGPWPEVRMSAAVEKEFTVVEHYHYRERRYDPPIPVATLAAAPESYLGPEEVLAGMLSAMKKLDYDWWLNTWDAESRQLILRRDEAMGVTREARLETWAQKVGQTNATLVRWAETGQHVILTYRRHTAEGEGKEQPVAVKLSDTGWTATLELAEDPVFRHLISGERRIERKVR